MYSLSLDDAKSRNIAFLQTSPLFEDLNEATLDTLGMDFGLRKHCPDEIIFHQGDESRDLHLIVQGKARVFKISPSGEETSIVIFSSGDVIGEYAAVDRRLRPPQRKRLK